MPRSVSSTSVKNFTLASFFAGVGGIELGFEQTNEFRVVYANELDKNAQTTYQENFPETNLDIRDIHDVDENEVPDIDVLTGGFPCQAFSIAGYRKGFEDDRGDLFFEMLRIIQTKKPKVVFFENVKNLVSHDHGNTFKVIREALVANGYYIKWNVLNGKDHGNIPQNRERIYIVGFDNKETFDLFEFPEEVELTTELDDIINFEAPVDEAFYYREGKQPFYEALEEGVTSKETIYQWRRQYVRENKSGVVPTLTANMGTGGHNVPLVLTDYGIRKLTPRETFNAQAYPEDYVLPEMANSHLYKQAGNSVVVPVIRRIANNIFEALKQSDPESSLNVSDDAKYAIVYTDTFGNNNGKSYVYQYADSMDQVKDILTSKPDWFPTISDDDYIKIVKNKKALAFYSIVVL